VLVTVVVMSPGSDRCQPPRAPASAHARLPFCGSRRWDWSARPPYIEPRKSSPRLATASRLLPAGADVDAAADCSDDDDHAECQGVGGGAGRHQHQGEAGHPADPEPIHQRGGKRSQQPVRRQLDAGLCPAIIQSHFASSTCTPHPSAADATCKYVMRSGLRWAVAPSMRDCRIPTMTRSI
jgi:hypothetical protein